MRTARPGRPDKCRNWELRQCWPQQEQEQEQSTLYNSTYHSFALLSVLLRLAATVPLLSLSLVGWCLPAYRRLLHSAIQKSMPQQ